MSLPRPRWSSLALLALASLPTAQRTETPALDLTPFGQPHALGARPELVPLLAGDTVLVSSSLRLFAFAADTGELRWTGGPPFGWDALEPHARDDLFRAVDAPRSRIAPAAGERIAVAALQLPRARREADEWQGIVLRRPIPERRLFAFELATGRALWDHAPPPAWDGASGSFAQRMRVIGAPLVAGEHVLVPCTYDESSIDYHVACYDLASGVLEWATFVTRGQVVRTVYGDQQYQEFAAAPLVLDAERARVLAQTGLGLVAALDLVSGAIRWRAEYAAIPLPRTKSYTPPRRAYAWRNTPPLVAGDTLLSTPLDSAELLALDLGDGHLLWRRSAKELAALDADTRELAFDHVIAAEGGVIYLGGAKLSALDIVGGLRSPRFPVPLWTRALDDPRSFGPARLSAGALLVPGASGTRAFDARTGEPLGSFAHGDACAELVTAEALFVLTPNGLERIPR